MKYDNWSTLHKKIDIQHYDNHVILNHPDVQSLLVKKEFKSNRNLQLFDLKSVLPEFYNWCEDFFNSKITVTRFFVSLPNSTTIVHEDFGYHVALNIPVINCNKYSKNVWYNVDRSKKPNLHRKRDASSVNYAANDGTAFIFSEDSIIEPIFEMILDCPTLFNASVPHNVITEEFEFKLYPRIVLSVRTESMKRSSNTSFEDFIKSY